MKKLIFCLIMILCFLSAAYAVYYDLGDDAKSQINFSIVPYNGTYNINMRADYYPQYEAGADRLTWEGKSIPENKKNDNTKYWDSQMVAAVTVYNIPKSITVKGVSYSLHADSIYLKATADCVGGFNFVSQSNPSIIRPFNLYGVDNYKVFYAYNPGGYSGDPYSDKLICFTPPNDNVWSTNALGEKFGSNDNYANFWLDFIFSLPVDDGGVSQSGVMIGGAQYPLVDANDYSALVSISAILRIVYYADDGSGEYEFSKNMTLPIPFSGYSNAISAYEEEKTSIYINTSTANINLNREYTARWINIGTIDFMQNFLYGDAVVQPPAESRAVSRIFFSASSDPLVQNSNGFRFIHKDAGNVLTSNNSVRFYLRFEGEGKSASEGYKYFDGKGYTISSDMMDGIVGDYVTSTCDNDQYILNTNQVNKRRAHFHTIEGSISILVDDNPDIMQAGTYYGNVYVHIITDDLGK